MQTSKAYNSSEWKLRSREAGSDSTLPVGGSTIGRVSMKILEMITECRCFGAYKQSNHPTEKPEFLIGGLIEIFTHPYEIVLDSFAGGGTTGVAAYKKGRHCISIEKERGYINTIKTRQAKAEKYYGGH